MSTILTTGHRDADGPALRNAVWHILRHAWNKGYHHLVNGAARGCDQLVAEVALELGFRFVAAVPCLGQERKWDAFDQKRYWRILSHPNTIVEYVSDKAWTKGCFFARNHWMARFINPKDDLVIGFRSRKKSGTQNCINACHKEQIRNVTIFNPETLQWEH